MGSFEPTYGRPMAVPESVGPGYLENVDDYPRPPRLEPVTSRLSVEVWGQLIAETTDGLRVLEAGFPPAYFIPVDDVAMALLSEGDRRTRCEYRGTAVHWDLRMARHRICSIAWSYPEPWPGYEALKDHLAFHPGRCSRCLLGGEAVRSLTGDGHGGWITGNLTGRFRGRFEPQADAAG